MEKLLFRFSLNIQEVFVSVFEDYRWKNFLIWSKTFRFIQEKLRKNVKNYIFDKKKHI